MISLTNHCRDERHEQNLLLLAHGGLSFPRRGLMEAHLRICPHCREERDRLLSVSALMAGAVRADAGLPPWRPRIVSALPAARGRVFLTRPLPAWAVALVLVLLLAGASVAAALVYGPTGAALVTEDALLPMKRDAASRKMIDPKNPDCKTTPVRAAPATN